MENEAKEFLRYNEYPDNLVGMKEPKKISKLMIEFTKTQTEPLIEENKKMREKIKSIHLFLKPFIKEWDKEDEIFKDLIDTFVTFPIGNNIGYYQDMGFWKNVPSNIKFRITKITNKSFVLYAAGFGEQGNYGNGSIFVDKYDVKKILDNA